MRRGSKRSSRRLGTTGLALAVALAVPGVASAAARAVATTGAASNVAQSTASLNGTVNPRGSATVYLFEYGPTTSYGGVTALTPVGSGTKAVKVTVPIGGLAPATTYHYRLFVSSPTGTRRAKGRDRTFKTMRQPLGVTLYGTPNPVRTGSSTTLAGTLTGTGNAGRQVVLQANPWPYTQGFLNVSNSLVTDASGNFAFPVLSVPVNTQFRVLMPQKPEVASPVVVVGALVRVTTHVRVTRGSRAGRVRLDEHRLDQRAPRERRPLGVLQVAAPASRRPLPRLRQRGRAARPERRAGQARAPRARLISPSASRSARRACAAAGRERRRRPRWTARPW
jgi:hypothetical protein